MTTTHSQDDISELAKQAANGLKESDPHLFDLAAASTPTALEEREALRDEERAYRAATDGVLKTNGITGADLISEDRGE